VTSVTSRAIAVCYVASPRAVTTLGMIAFSAMH